MKISAHGASHTGKVRERNEDAWLAAPDLGCYVVCDGMGGHAGGDVAAGTAIGAVRDFLEERAAVLERIRDGREPAESLVRLAREAVLRACLTVHRTSLADPELTGMGTTLTMVLLAGTHAALGHVGDSRCYLLRGGAAAQLSRDHTFEAELIAQGILPPGRAAGNPYGRALSRCVGHQPAVEVETLPIELQAGDRLVLCSDGLTRYLEHPEELAGLAEGTASDRLSDELVGFALARGGKDNVTVVTVTIEGPAVPSQPADAASDTELLAGTALFRGLPLRDRAAIAAACRSREFAAGDLLLEPGLPLREWWLIASGELQLWPTESVKHHLVGGDTLGEAALLLVGPSRFTVRALTDGRLLLLDHQAFADLCRQRPRLGLTLYQRLGQRATVAADRWRDRLRQAAPGVWESNPIVDRH